MKLLSFISALALIYTLTPPALAQSPLGTATIQPGNATLASLLTQNHSTTTLQTGDIISDSQNAAGYQLTGEVLLQLTAQADFDTLSTSYNLQLKHNYAGILVVTAQTANLKQLVAQLLLEPTVLKASYDLRELGLSPDPQVKNEPQ